MGSVIRYLGSMVSSIQLLDEGTINAPDGARETILRHAKVLADKLAPGFDSPTGIIWPRVDFQRNLGIDDDGRQTKTARVHLARAGSHWLEYAVLSELTGDDTYVKNSTKAWNWVVKRGDDEEWPGLVNSPRSVVTGRSLGMTRTLGSPDDSHYEVCTSLSREDIYTYQKLTSFLTLLVLDQGKSSLSEGAIYQNNSLPLGRSNDVCTEISSFLLKHQAGTCILGAIYK